jgi:hypothetical protein
MAGAAMLAKACLRGTFNRNSLIDSFEENVKWPNELGRNDTLERETNGEGFEYSAANENASLTTGESRNPS